MRILKAVCAATSFLSLILASPGLAQINKPSPDEIGRICSQIDIRPRGALPVILEIKGAKPVKFVVEMATTAREQSQGLMCRSQIPLGGGMIFIYNDMAPRSFWMKNTLIPLDIIYADNKGKIVSIAHNAQPHDLKSKASLGNAQYVLEIRGGLAKKLGLKPGDKIKSPGLIS
jgi:uncharacterized membrane protein (UPF0127 family)